MFHINQECRYIKNKDDSTHYDQDFRYCVGCLEGYKIVFWSRHLCGVYKCGKRSSTWNAGASLRAYCNVSLDMKLRAEVVHDGVMVFGIGTIAEEKDKEIFMRKINWADACKEIQTINFDPVRVHTFFCGFVDQDDDDVTRYCAKFNMQKFVQRHLGCSGVVTLEDPSGIVMGSDSDFSVLNDHLASFQYGDSASNVLYLFVRHDDQVEYFLSQVLSKCKIKKMFVIPIRGFRHLMKDDYIVLAPQKITVIKETEYKDCPDAEPIIFVPDEELSWRRFATFLRRPENPR